MLKNYKTRTSCFIVLLITPLLSTHYLCGMEETPGSSSPDHIAGAAAYYAETLHAYDTSIPEKKIEFNHHFKKIIEAIEQEKTPWQQLKNISRHDKKNCRK